MAEWGICHTQTLIIYYLGDEDYFNKLVWYVENSELTPSAATVQPDGGWPHEICAGHALWTLEGSLKICLNVLAFQQLYICQSYFQVYLGK